jgi:hypothetical protein
MMWDVTDSYRDFSLTSNIIQPPTYLLWLLRLAKHLRVKVTKDAHVNCLFCDRTEATWPLASFLRFSHCLHTICMVCFWSNAEMLDLLTEYERDGKFLGADSSEHVALLWDRDSHCVKCGASSSSLSFATKTAESGIYSTPLEERLLLLPPMQCKSASLRRFAQLDKREQVQRDPEDGQEPQEVVHNYLSVFKAAPLCESAGWILGTIPSRRSEELLKAAESGDTRRLAALIEAGVDLETRYERE